MSRNRYSSPITISDDTDSIFPNELTDGIVHCEDADSSTESDSSGVDWWAPENQLGLEPEQQNDPLVALDEGEIKHHEAMAKY
jgi:hypothetical protein